MKVDYPDDADVIITSVDTLAIIIYVHVFCRHPPVRVSTRVTIIHVRVVFSFKDVHVLYADKRVDDGKGKADVRGI